MAKPYERREDESAAAWAAFVVYREMPAESRSLEAAYRQAKGRSTKAPQHWKDWGRDNDWEARAAAYDRDQDAATRKASLQRIVNTRQRQASVFEATQRTLSAPVMELVKRLAEGRLDLSKATDADLYKLVLLAAPHLPRLAESELALLGDTAPPPASRFVGEAKAMPTSAERAAAVAAVLDEVGELRPGETVIDVVAEVRELPRRAAG